MISITGCKSNNMTTIDSSKYAEPQYLYNKNSDIDMFVYEDTVFENVSEIDWVKELELTKGNLLGTIKETAVSKDFKDWDATILEIGSNIYKTDRADILLVEINGLMIPYLKIVEG
nr:hypothetical protein [Tissierella sp.]